MRIDFTNTKRVVWEFVLLGLFQLIALASHYVVGGIEMLLTDGLWGFCIGNALVIGVVTTNLMYCYNNPLKTES